MVSMGGPACSVCSSPACAGGQEGEAASPACNCPPPNPPPLAGEGAHRVRGNGLLRGLARILDGLEGRELLIIELAVDLLDLADVDVLHDIARVGVDRDRSARALPLHALDGGHQLVAVCIA